MPALWGESGEGTRARNTETRASGHRGATTYGRGSGDTNGPADGRDGMYFPKRSTAPLIAAMGVVIATAAAAGARVQSVSDPAHTVRVDLELVLVPVSVTDANGAPVGGLGRGDFRLWEDRIEQEIEYFSAESVPASIGIVLDTSNSMNGAVQVARGAVAAFLEAGHLEDEYFLLEFSDQPHLREDFTGDVSQLRNRIVRTPPNGQTALYDAVYRAISKAQQGQHARKALLIVTDGEDNNSRYSRTNLENYVREAGVQIWAIGISSSFGKGVLRELTGLTGGEAVFADDDDDMETISREVAMAMTSQYLLGYVSTNRVRDGGWRELRVRIDGGEDAPSALSVRAKRGYYARAY